MCTDHEIAFPNGFKPGKTYKVPEVPPHMVRNPDLDLPRSLDSIADDDLADNLESVDDTPNISDRPPFGPPTDLTDDSEAPEIDTHPHTDDLSGLDSTELYNEGLEGASEFDDTSKNSAAISYNPHDD